jgi:hypothetical protein
MRPRKRESFTLKKNEALFSEKSNHASTVRRKSLTKKENIEFYLWFVLRRVRLFFVPAAWNPRVTEYRELCGMKRP